LNKKIFLIIKDQSERVKNKNFREICGVPLHEFYIRQRECFDIYIDTDSERIMEFYSDKSKWPNIKVYERAHEHVQMENSGNDSPAPKMIERFLKEHVDNDEEPIITSHITSPLLSNKSILEAYDYMSKYDSVSSVDAVQEFCVFENRPINFDNSKIVKTQSLQPVNVLNGAFFIIKKNVYFLNKYRRISDNHLYYPIPKIEAVDIDTEHDLKIAKILAEEKK
jgi:N-acylneuraminate cytidylyltransferase